MGLFGNILSQYQSMQSAASAPEAVADPSTAIPAAAEEDRERREGQLAQNASGTWYYTGDLPEDWETFSNYRGQQFARIPDVDNALFHMQGQYRDPANYPANNPRFPSPYDVGIPQGAWVLGPYDQGSDHGGLRGGFENMNEFGKLALIALATALGAPEIAPLLGGGTAGAAGAAGLTTAGASLATGAEFEDALRSGLLSAGAVGIGGLGSDVNAPPATSAVPGSTGVSIADLPAWQPPLSGPASVLTPDGSMFVDSAASAAAAGVPWAPLGMSFEGMLGSVPSMPAPDVSHSSPMPTSSELQRAARVARNLYGMVGSPPDAPQRAEGQSDAAYADDLAQYIGLDVASMADAGLTPGTPEYYEYIMQRADVIIESIMGGMEGVDPADLAQQLRSKTEAELVQLQRALYVRGAMNQMMGAGTYADPVTGIEEEVYGPEGAMFNPGVGAYQRGLARDVTDLAGRQGDDAYQFLSGMLSREPDMFGMQAAADEAYDRALLEDNDELRRRRGMFG